jgi:lysophospholipase L1-like esterase
MKQNAFEQHPVRTLLGLFVAFIFIVVIATETLLSLSKQASDDGAATRYIRLKEHLPSSVRYEAPDDTAVIKTDGLVQKEYRFEIDDNGFVYPSGIHEKPDATLLFLGGSTTESIYVDEEIRFPYLAGKLLESKGLKINSYNSGVSGNNTMHSINILLNKGLPLQPDIAVLMHAINDLIILLYERNYWNNNPSRSLLIEIQPKNNTGYAKNLIKALVPELYRRLWLLKNKYLADDNIQKDEFAHIRGKSLNVNKQDIINKFEGALLTFISVCKSNGITPVLMTQANRFKEEPDKVIIDDWSNKMGHRITYREYKDIYDAMNEKTRELGKSQGVLVIDLARSVPQESDYMYDSVHLENYGSRYVAELIANQLEPLVISTKSNLN